MEIGLEAEHFDAVYEGLKEHCTPSGEQLHPEDAVFLLPEQVGKGYLMQTKLRHGMALSWSRMELREPVVMDVGVRYPHMELSFTLEGDGSWSRHGTSREYGLCGGTGNLMYMHNEGFHAEQYAGKPIDHMEVRIDFALWRHLLSPLPWQAEASFYCRPCPLTPHVRDIIGELRSCAYSGAIRQLYLEGKCMELIAVCLDESGGGHGELLQEAARGLRKSDAEALVQARDILARTWQEPPSLMQLARMVGLNDFKLKSGFKELFGTTVFGYVRRMRMQEARLLLEKGQANVSEAAYRVGYTNVSHFASQFHKAFGSSPGEFLSRRNMVWKEPELPARKRREEERGR